MRSTLDCGNFSIDYCTFGRGKKPMVIIPGLSLKDVLTFAPAVEAQFEKFCADHTVYLFDRRNGLPTGFGVPDMAEDMAKALKKLGVCGACVYGTSQGGMIALALAARAPELVSRIAAVSSLYKQNAVSRETFSSWLEIYGQNRRDLLTESLYGRVYSKEYFEKNRRAFELVARTCTDSELERFGILSQACLDFDLSAEIKNIRCPVLAIGAECDRVLTGEASREVIEALGQGEFVMINGASHAVYDEDPGVLERVKRFFE